MSLIPAPSLPDDVRCVGSSESFTQDTLPPRWRPLRPEPGEWWVVQVDHGRVRVIRDGEVIVSKPGRPVVVGPLIPFHVDPDGPTRLRFVRHRRPGDGRASHLTQH